MLKYGKTAQTAVTIVTFLAEHYAEDEVVFSSLRIAEACNMQKPLVAKLLTQLSQTRLVKGTPGPRGGYCLAKDPSDITLLQVVEQFESLQNRLIHCPYGPNHCGVGPQCPLHDTLATLNEQLMTFLRTTTFDCFQP